MALVESVDTSRDLLHDQIVLPDEIVERIARLSGWETWLSTWSKVSSKYRPLSWLRESHPDAQQTITVVPVDVPTINAGISSAKKVASSSVLPRLVLIMPGVYHESVRVTDDLTLIGLGSRGAVRVHSQGWEPALVLGGFSVGKAKLHGDAQLDAASAGGRAVIRGLTLSMRNQQQAVAVYCTGGQPLVADCDVLGTVRVSGCAAAPTFVRCRISRSRSNGVRICDHAQGQVRRSELLCNQLAAIRLSPCARPNLSENRFDGNGIDGVHIDEPADGTALDSDDEELVLGANAFHESDNT